jgi:hypothetical protein
MRLRNSLGGNGGKMRLRNSLGTNGDKRGVVNCIPITKQKLRKAYPFLKIIAKLNQEDRQVILQYIDENAVGIIAECVLNAITNKAINNRKELRLETSGAKNICRYISNSKKKGTLKRKKIEKIGGSLGMILAAVLPLLAQFIGSK